MILKEGMYLQHDGGVFYVSDVSPSIVYNHYIGFQGDPNESFTTREVVDELMADNTISVVYPTFVGFKE